MQRILGSWDRSRCSSSLTSSLLFSIISTNNLANSQTPIFKRYGLFLNAMTRLQAQRVLNPSTPVLHILSLLHTFSVVHTRFQCPPLVFIHFYSYLLISICFYPSLLAFTCLHLPLFVPTHFTQIPTHSQPLPTIFIHLHAFPSTHTRPPTPIITNTMGPWRTQARDAFASQPFKLGIGKPGMRNVGPIMM